MVDFAEKRREGGVGEGFGPFGACVEGGLRVVV